MICNIEKYCNIVTLFILVLMIPTQYIHRVQGVVAPLWILTSPLLDDQPIYIHIICYLLTVILLRVEVLQGIILMHVRQTNDFRIECILQDGNLGWTLNKTTHLRGPRLVNEKQKW